MTTDWQPIETALKDRRILLWRPTHTYDWCRMVMAIWDDDKYARKPHPHWNTDTIRLEGRANAKSTPATHWMEPEPPNDS